MAWTEATFLLAFDEEAGDAASLATTTEKDRWFNQGMHRLGKWKGYSTALTWAAGDKTESLPQNFIQVYRLVYDTGIADQPWYVFGTGWGTAGKQLIIRDPAGASAAGTATLYYWGYWPDMSATVASELPPDLDAGCLYYALHRFFRKLASNRVQYSRYSTLLGANAVSVADLQNESDRLLQDYLDTRADDSPAQPAGFYEE
jgi:hypothetical protein